MATLVIRAGRVRVLEFELGRLAVVIGRDAQADINLNDTKVSRRHAQVEPSGDGYVVRDLDSRNGLVVAGRRVGSLPLRAETVFSIGTYEIEFREDRKTAKARTEEVITAIESADRDPTSAISPFSALADGESRTMARLVAAVGTATSPGDAVERLVAAAVLGTEADAGFVVASETKIGDHAVRAGRIHVGASTVQWSPTSAPLGLLKRIEAEGVSQIDDLRTHELGAEIDAALGARFSSLVAIPVRDGLGTLGMLVLLSRLRAAFRNSSSVAVSAATLAAPHLAAERASEALHGDLDELRRAASDTNGEARLVAVSPKFRDLVEKFRSSIARVPASARMSILLLGETGSGKEALARFIQRTSRRAKAPFVPVNSGALAPTLAHAELFGVEEHVATGVKHRLGLIEQADRGILFLDEVGELLPDGQKLLLRVLQEGKLRRVGSDKEIDVSVWVIAATNRDLAKEIAAGRFREDLYYRLNLLELRVPPLRERAADVPVLAEMFCGRFAREFARPIDGVSDAALAALRAHDWPGNVRELEHAIGAAVLMARGRRIGVQDLPASVIGPGAAAPRGQRDRADDRRPLKDVEREHIDRVLRGNDWNRTKAAKTLGIARSTLDTKIALFGLQRDAAP